MNHRNLKIALASAALAVSGAAMADGPGWTYFQGQAGWGDAPDDGENTQYGASGSIQLFNMLHLGGTYTAGKFDATGIDDSDVDNWNIVFGSHVAVSDTADVFADVIFGNIDPDDLGDDSDYYGGRPSAITSPQVSLIPMTTSAFWKKIPWSLICAGPSGTRAGPVTTKVVTELMFV
jgi:hypothetical protein